MRLYTKKHINQKSEQIAKLLSQFSLSSKPEELFFADAMQYVSKADFVYCPETNEEPVGIGYIFPCFCVPNLGMAVLPAYQGNGYGTDIMREALNYTGSHSGLLVSSIWKENKPIIKLHIKSGFYRIYEGKQADWWAITFSSSAQMICFGLAKALKYYDQIRYRGNDNKSLHNAS